jgi:hypothetical protein
MAGRPSIFTPELASEICHRLADGETLTAICRDANMPHERTVRDWARDDVQGFSPQYARARETGYHRMFDQIIDIADTPVIGTKTITKGNGEVQTIVGDMIEHRRLQVDTRKWALAKALPKIYGDRLAVDAKHQAVDGNGEPMDAVSVAQRIAFVMSKAMRQLDEQAKPGGQGTAKR